MDLLLTRRRSRLVGVRLGLMSALASIAVFAGTASATPIWNTGDLITYGEGDWSDSGVAFPLLLADYSSVYAATSGVVTWACRARSAFI